MKASRFRRSYRKSASGLHKRIGDLLKGTFRGHKIYQEYPVNRVNGEFKSGRERYDWVLLDLKVVIEVQGQQHYKPITIGGVSQEEAEKRFHRQLVRDEKKKVAAEHTGFGYLAIPHQEVGSLTPAQLLQKVLGVIPGRKPSSSTHPRKWEKPKSYIKYLELARQYRCLQYRRAKEWKKQRQKERNSSMGSQDSQPARKKVSERQSILTGDAS